MILRLLPLLVLIAYVLLGLGISIFGPVEYKDYNYQAVTAYILAFLVLFSIGYGFGLAAPSSTAFMSSQANSRLVSSIFGKSLFLAFLLLVIDFLSKVSSGALNFDLNSLGQTYIQNYSGYERNSGSYSFDFVLATIDAVPFFVATVWGLLYFRNLTFSYKVLVIVLIGGTLLMTTIGQGKQKQLGDFAIYVASILAVGFGLRGRIRKRDIVVFLVIVAITITAFGYVSGQRYAAINLDLSNIGNSLHPLMKIRYDSEVFAIFGPKVGFAIFLLSQYLSNGYYGLSLGLNLDFSWTWFLGSSYSLSVVFNRFLGFPFMYDLTYPARIGDETGWGISKWHTIFSWLASDMTYPGALIFLAVVGFLYARVWKEAIAYRNPFSILVFSLLNVGLVYIPANNQLVHSPGGLLVLATTLSLYFVFGPRYNLSRRVS